MAFAASTSLALADTIVFDFTGSQGGAIGEGPYNGNVRTFWSGPDSTGVRLDVTGWGYTYDTGSRSSQQNVALQSGRLGRWSSGLGVCNRAESCQDPYHQVDNDGIDDWVLFFFSEAVDVTSVRIDPYRDTDRDVSYYLGNVTGPLNLTGVRYSDLDELGFGAVQNSTASSSSSARNVTINGGFVNALLVGGYLGGTDQDDWFKIVSITADTPSRSIPEPGSLLLMLSGAAMAVPVLRRRVERRK